MRLKKMKISSQLKSGIYEVSFRYNTNLGGYRTLMSDIPKLSEIVDEGEKDEFINNKYMEINI
jgi:hypothetical protein